MTRPKRVVRVALLLCDTPVRVHSHPSTVIADSPQHQSIVDVHGDCQLCPSSPRRISNSSPDHKVYRDWLLQALASYPDQSIATGTELIIDGYDVVEKKEYPPAQKLSASSEEGYDVVMMTGSSETRAESCRGADKKNIPLMIPRTPSSLPWSTLFGSLRHHLRRSTYGSSVSVSATRSFRWLSAESARPGRTVGRRACTAQT